MNKEKEEMLEKLREIKQTAELDLQEKPGYENYEVKNVKYYGKVELMNKRTGEKESFDLHVIEVADKNIGEIELFYYLNGKEIDFAELLRDYESPEPIKDLVDRAEENKEKPEKEQDKKLKIEDLNELEEEKQQEEKGETKNKDKKKDEKEESKNDLTGKKPKGVVQRIDPNKAYVNSVETVSNAYEIPSDVDELVIADTQAGDENALSDNKTIYMLDKDDKIIGESNGKKINELFEYDDSTGNNPMYDDNTKIELAGHAEKNKGQTMARFKSKENPDLYLSAEQKKWGNYAQVYAEQKTRDGNDAVGIELEVDNSAIQTDLEKQKIMGYGSGDYKKEYVDEEADMHEEHGDNEMNIAIANADGNELTRETCDNPFVPDTNITWEQFSKSVGDKDINELMKEFFEKYDGNNGQELILKIQSDYKEQKDIEQKSENEKEEDLGRFREGPWDKQ